MEQRSALSRRRLPLPLLAGSIIGIVALVAGAVLIFSPSSTETSTVAADVDPVTTGAIPVDIGTIPAELDKPGM